MTKFKIISDETDLLGKRTVTRACEVCSLQIKDDVFPFAQVDVLELRPCVDCLAFDETIRETVPPVEWWPV